MNDPIAAVRKALAWHDPAFRSGKCEMSHRFPDGTTDHSGCDICTAIAGLDEIVSFVAQAALTGIAPLNAEAASLEATSPTKGTVS